MDEIFNERLRSTSAWLNQLATAVMVVGALTPAAGLYYGLYSLRPDGSAAIAIGYSFAVSGALHAYARDILGSLQT